VNETVARDNLRVNVLNLGLPDAFLGHGKAADLLADCGLDSAGIEASIRQRLS
jgi:1-deoxy-D-xylulose-5-phosphate synthase